VQVFPSLLTGKLRLYREGLAPFYLREKGWG
jgi:hypothetical protein